VKTDEEEKTDKEDKTDKMILEEVQERFKCKVTELPTVLDTSLYM